MKLLILIIVFLIRSQAFVTSKFIFDTTNSPIDDVYEEFVTSGKESVAGDENEKDYSGYIYLDDVVSGLKSQNWTKEELPCLNATLHLISSLQNFTMWAVWEWDSISSQPLGILSGNRYQLGNFDQCMTSPWSSHHEEIKTQYCLADVALETDGHVKKKTLYEIEPYGNAIDLIQHNTPNYRPLKYLTWGACVPACCEPKSVERLVGAVLARSHLGQAGLRPHIHVNETCQRPDDPKKFEPSFYAFIGVVATLFVVCIVCTIINNRRKTEISRSSPIYKAFCLEENFKDLLRIKTDGLETIYGIRYLTICFIVMCHQAALIDAGSISNGIKMDEIQKIFLSWLVLHDDLLVDTFFLISAFLVAKGLLEFKSVPSLFVLIFKRYIRLVVGFAMMVFFIAAAFPYVGSGPLWNRFSDDESSACSDNWWVSLLMLSNYVHSERICLVVSWYIPCDFHFYVIAVILFAVYKKSSKLGVIVTITIAAASIITPGVINYVNNLPAIQLFTYEFIMNPRQNRQFLVTYIKSHTRAAAYVVGFFAGCLFMHLKAKGNVRISKARSVAYVCAAISMMVFMAFLGVSYQIRTYSELEAHVYAALNRPVWAAGVALLILTCSFGQVPLLTSFLSWYPWVPLSRLAYGVYLIHFMVIVRNIGISRNPGFYDHFDVLLISLGVICISTFFALVLWLFFEAPANNLLMLLFKRKTTTTSSNTSITPANVESCSRERGKTNSGFIEDNLPDSIQFSKM